MRSSVIPTARLAVEVIEPSVIFIFDFGDISIRVQYYSYGASALSYRESATCLTCRTKTVTDLNNELKAEFRIN